MNAGYPIIIQRYCAYSSHGVLFDKLLPCRYPLTLTDAAKLTETALTEIIDILLRRIISSLLHISLQIADNEQTNRRAKSNCDISYNSYHIRIT